LGLLPERRVGINSVDPDRASVDGKIVKFFPRLVRFCESSRRWRLLFRPQRPE
jgi:hypothetical protein